MREEIVEDFAQRLSKKVNAAIANFHKFRLVVFQERDAVFLFFEGVDDQKFYMGAIRQKLIEHGQQNRVVHKYICNGKDGVLEARGLIRAGVSFQDACLLFFIDKDFDDYLGNDQDLRDDTYCTEWYSVESYLTCEQAISVLWQDFVPFDQQELYLKLIGSFQMAHQRFIRSMSLITAWCIYQRLYAKKLNLSNARLARIFKIGNEGSFSKNGFAFAEFAKQVATADASYSTPIYMAMDFNWLTES
jgi:hypothetical protein